MTYLSHLLIRQTLKILLNEKITGFTPLKPKHHWDLMLKMVFRRNSSYFASLIMFMDGLYLDNDFRTQFLSFYYFYCYCCCLLVLLLLFLVLLFCFIIIIIIVIIIIIYSLKSFLFFVAMLGIILLSYSNVLIFMFMM